MPAIHFEMHQKEDVFFIDRAVGTWIGIHETSKCQWQNLGVEYIALHYKNSFNFTQNV